MPTGNYDALIQQLTANPPYRDPNHPAALSVTQMEQVFAQHVWPQYEQRITPQAAPTAFFVGAQPGAGKSSAVGGIRQQLHGDVVDIDADTYRQFHPNDTTLKTNMDSYLDNTGPLSSTMLRMLIARSLDEGVNVIIEGTMRNPPAVQGSMRDAQQAGHNTDVTIIAARQNDSYMGVLYRDEKFKEQGDASRPTAKAIHDESYNNIPRLIHEVSQLEVEGEHLVDRMTIVNRAGAVVARSTDMAQDGEALIAALNKERGKGYSTAEARVIMQQRDYVASKIEERRVNGTSTARDVETQRFLDHMYIGEEGTQRRHFPQQGLSDNITQALDSTMPPPQHEAQGKKQFADRRNNDSRQVADVLGAQGMRELETLHRQAIKRPNPAEESRDNDRQQQGQQGQQQGGGIAR